MDYINRISAFEEEQYYSLTNDGIECENGTISYESINSIHLKYVPTRYYSNIYQCKISHEKGLLTLSNRRYIKLGTFEYQSDSFNRFVKQLCKQLPDNVKLNIGLNRLRYWTELPIAIGFFTLIIGIIFTFGHPLLAILFLNYYPDQTDSLLSKELS
jgi:hypothetical protein